MIDLTRKLFGFRDPLGTPVHKAHDRGVYFTYEDDTRRLRVYRLNNDELVDSHELLSWQDPLQYAQDIQEDYDYDRPSRTI